MKVGDEGINRGSEWFILTAIIVPKEYDTTLSNKIVSIKNTMGMNRKDQLHWNKILKYDKKIQIIYSLISENFKIIHIAINTYQIKKLKSKDIYPYFMSYLIERVSSYVSTNKGKCDIFISTRQDNNKEKNNHLKNELMSKRSYHHICTKCINDIKFVDNRDRNLLQLADVCCSSFSQAIKNNTKQEWEYVLKLKSNLWTLAGKLIGYGIKFYPPIEYTTLFLTLLYLAL